MAISKINSKALVDCSVADVDIEDGSITNAKLAGSIANAKLANSSITVNGNTVSLGASGSIPPVAWQSVVTADGSTTTTAVSGNGYFIDTTSAAHTITLPASPSAGDYVAIKDYAGTFGTNALTIGRNSSNIQGVANDSQISTNRASVVLVYIDATKGWLYTVESNVADLGAPLFVTATGGTETTDGDYKIHTFTGDGTLCISCAGNADGSNTVDYLVIAGGGAGGGKTTGGNWENGGGGGAGGYRESVPSPAAWSASPLANPGGALPVSAQGYPVTVGAGAAGIGSKAPNGSNSVFSTITSAGGGAGGGNDAPNQPGNPGGSGGGGAGNGGPGGTGNTPSVSPPQGNNGGNGGPAAATPDNANTTGGGGGGAGAAASNSPGSTATAGGNGVTSSINASPVTRAGGGGASGIITSSGGSGGGGAGGQSGGTAGTANTGSGGGGAGASGVTGNAGSGGKGIVIIRYKYQ